MLRGPLLRDQHKAISQSSNNQATSLSIDNQATITPSPARTMYSHLAPLHDIHSPTIAYRSRARSQIGVDTWALRHHRQRSGRCRCEACCRGHPLNQLPMVPLLPTLSSPQSTPPVVADLAQAERRLPFPSFHKALCHIRTPSTCSHAPLPDEAICLLPYLLGRPNWHRPELGLRPRCSAAPPVSTPGGPSLRPWTSSPPGMMPN